MISGSPYVEGMDEVETTEEVKVQAAQEYPVGSNNPSDYIKGNTRQEGELYCDFRARLYWEHLVMKHYFAGTVVWTGKQRGEARNPARMTRVSKGRDKKDKYNERLQRIQDAQGKRKPEQVDVYHREAKKDFVEKCRDRG